ncbi:MAG TPA: hypothetical protein VEX86_20270 [Longimicrobium sp.]|nr:hypothetical protein [Longimicrobium sp.]
MAIQQEIPSLQGTEPNPESTRKWIATWALGSYFVLLAIILLAGWLVMAKPLDDVLKAVTTVAGILGGVVGTIVGFYFRDKN